MIFERENKYLYYRVIILHIFPIISLSIKDVEFKTVLLVWLIMVLLPNFLFLINKSAKLIDVADKSISITFTNLFKSIIETYKYDELKITYLTETGVRGVKSSEFRIYSLKSDRMILSVGGSFDGWTDEIIYDLIDNLKENNVKVIQDVDVK